jgi:hypothetical protein
MGIELTESAVGKLTCTVGANRLVADSKQAHLYLRVSKKGLKTWQARKRHAGKWVVETLGHWPKLEVKQARLKCAAVLAQLEGVGALEARRTRLQAPAGNPPIPRQRHSGYRLEANSEREA